MKRGQGSFSQQVNRAVPGDMSASKALCALTDQKMALACSSCRSLFYSSSRSICDFRSHETHCIKNAGAFTRSLTALCRTDIIERHMSGNTGAQEFCLAVCQLSLTRAPRRFSRVRPESPSRRPEPPDPAPPQDTQPPPQEGQSLSPTTWNQRRAQ